MIKKLNLTMGCLALLASFASVARADAISFSLLFSPTPVHAGAVWHRHSRAGNSDSSQTHLVLRGSAA
jgi:hypothetical protein